VYASLTHNSITEDHKSSNFMGIFSVVHTAGVAILHRKRQRYLLVSVRLLCDAGAYNSWTKRCRLFIFVTWKHHSRYRFVVKRSPSASPGFI